MILLNWLHVHLQINPLAKDIQGTPTPAAKAPNIKDLASIAKNT